MTSNTSLRSAVSGRNALFAIIACGFSIVSGVAQEMDNQTDLYYDSERNVVVVTASSTVDYNTQYYYTPYVNTTVFNSTGGVAWQYPDAWQPVYLEIAGAQGDEVIAESTHLLTAEYYTYEITGCDCSDYYDAYGYDLLAGTGDPSVNQPDFSLWVMYAPVIVTNIESQIIQSSASGGRLRPPGPPVNFDVAVRAFIAPLYVHGPEPYCSFLGDAGVLYNGNNRTYNRFSYAYKVHNSVMLLPNIGMGALPVTATGYSKRYQGLALSPDGTTLREDTVLHDCYLLDDGGQEQTFGMNIDLHSYAAQSITTHIYGSASNPLTPPAVTPSIDWDYWVTISTANPVSPQFSMSGSHDCFPAWEAYIGYTLINSYTPSDSSPATITYCLNGYGSITVNQSGTVPY
jgi:hypothetical protein